MNTKPLPTLIRAALIIEADAEAIKRCCTLPPHTEWPEAEADAKADYEDKMRMAGELRRTQERQEKLEAALEKIRTHAAAEVGWFAGYAGEVANSALREREMREGGGE